MRNSARIKTEDSSLATYQGPPHWTTRTPSGRRQPATATLCAVCITRPIGDEVTAFVHEESRRERRLTRPPLGIQQRGSFAEARAAQAPASQDQPLCQAPPGAVIYQNTRTLLIYDYGAHYGCIPSVGRVVLLGSLGYRDLRTAASAGDYIGYAVGRDDFEVSFYIRSLNTRTGRHVHTVSLSLILGGSAPSS